MCAIRGLQSIYRNEAALKGLVWRSALSCTRRRLKAVLLLGQRRRRFANIDATLGDRFVSAE